MPLCRYMVMLNMANYEKLYEKDYQKLLNKYDKKSDEYKQLKYEYQLLQLKYSTNVNDTIRM